MDFGPLFDAPAPIPLHALAAMAALVIGGVQMILRKGTALHRWSGRIWAGLMAAVAISSFFIFELRVIGPFSPIHLLSLITLVSLGLGIQAARRGDIKAHRSYMTSLFALALVVTGLFTLLPGRVMHAVVFGS